MSSKNYEMAAGAVRERRVFGHFSIGARLEICYTLSAFGMLAAVTTVQYWILIRGMEWDESQIVLDKIKMFEATLRVHGDNQAFLDHEVNLEGGAYWPEQHYIVYSRILDEAGRVIIETPDMERLIPETVFSLPVVPRQARDLKVVSYREAPNGHSYFLMSAWARSGGEDGPRRLIQVAMDETGERVMIASYRRDTLLVLFLGTLLFAVVGTFIAHRCLRPVHDLAQTLERIKPNDVISRINSDTSRWPRELTTLADSFYSMLFRIETSFNRCSQCAEDLAHEVRNPIHSLMGEAEVALSKDRTPDEYRQVLESSLEEYTRLSRMINELLFIARADNPCTAIERARFDVHGELEAVREFHDAQAQEQGITITCAGRASLDADPLLFRRAVSNLVSNALFHTSEGGRSASRSARRTGAAWWRLPSVIPAAASMQRISRGFSIAFTASNGRNCTKTRVPASVSPSSSPSRHFTAGPFLSKARRARAPRSCCNFLLLSIESRAVRQRYRVLYPLSRHRDYR
jgi:two-component system heavy metal sensor histidine kinase CusS